MGDRDTDSGAPVAPEEEGSLGDLDDERTEIVFVGEQEVDSEPDAEPAYPRHLDAQALERTHTGFATAPVPPMEADDLTDEERDRAEEATEVNIPVPPRPMELTPTESSGLSAGEDPATEETPTAPTPRPIPPAPPPPAPGGATRLGGKAPGGRTSSLAPPVDDEPVAVEIPNRSSRDADPRGSSFYPRSRRKRPVKVMDPFAPMIPRAGQDAGGGSAELADEGAPTAAEAAAPDQETAASAEGAAAPHAALEDRPELPSHEEVATARIPTAHAPAPAVAALATSDFAVAASVGEAPVPPGVVQPASRPFLPGLPTWGAFLVAYAATVAITLTVAWFTFDLSLAAPTIAAQGREPAPALAPAEAPEVAEANEAACHKAAGYWARPENLMHRYRFEMASGEIVAGAAAVTLEGCSLRVRLPDDELRLIPLLEIATYDRE